MMYHINHSKIWTYTFSRKCFSMILPVSTGDQGSTQWTGCRPLNMGCNDHPWHHKERVFYSSDSKWPNVTATPHMWSGLLPCSHHYDIARWVARRVRAIIYELQATIHEPRARISFTSCTFFRTCKEQLEHDFTGNIHELTHLMREAPPPAHTPQASSFVALFLMPLCHPKFFHHMVRRQYSPQLGKGKTNSGVG